MQAAELQGHDMAGGHCGLASWHPFRSHSMHMSMDIASATVALIDDRYGHNIEVLAMSLQVSSTLFFAGKLVDIARNQQGLFFF
jgi:hypothetical protein